MTILRWIFFLPAAWIAQALVKLIFSIVQYFVGSDLILDLFGDTFGRYVILLLMSIQVFIVAYAFTYVGIYVAPKINQKNFFLIFIPLLPFITTVITFTAILHVYLPNDLWVIEEYSPFITQKYFSIFLGYIPALLSIWFLKPVREFFLKASK